MLNRSEKILILALLAILLLGGATMAVRRIFSNKSVPEIDTNSFSGENN